MLTKDVSMARFCSAVRKLFTRLLTAEYFVYLYLNFQIGSPMELVTLVGPVVLQRSLTLVLSSMASRDFFPLPEFVPLIFATVTGKPTFDAYTDVPAGGCTGQTQAAWRIPVGIQLFPAIILGIGMFWMPFSPRWLTEVGRDEEALQTLSRLRKLPVDSEEVRYEFLEIKAEIMIVREIRDSHSAGKGMIGRLVQPYIELVSTRANFHRLAVGCLVMFYQQFIGCNVRAIRYISRTEY
jgi:hypothetical protein